MLDASTAFANKGNSDQARAMVDLIKTVGADVAPTVSGKNALGRGLSGWGNAGSSLEDGNSVSGRIKN